MTVDRGQSTIEVIVVLPLLCFLLWGICELALIYGQRSIACYAAYAAARIAAVADPQSRETRAAETARQIISASLGRRVNPLTLTVTCKQEDDTFEVRVGWLRKWLGKKTAKIAVSSRLVLEQ